MAGQEVHTPVRGSNLSTEERQEAPSYPPQENMSPSRAATPRQERLVPIGVILLHYNTFTSYNIEYNGIITNKTISQPYFPKTD